MDNNDNPIKTNPPPRTVGLVCKVLLLGLSISFEFCARLQNNLVQAIESNRKKQLSIMIILIPGSGYPQSILRGYRRQPPQLRSDFIIVHFQRAEQT